MNKIIAIIVLGLLTTNLQAQQLKSQVPATAKKMTAAEANALNGKAEPTINGIPYSQYKAQQDALKNQQAKQEAAPTLKVSPITNEELQKINKTDKQASAPVSPAAKPITTAERSN